MLNLYKKRARKTILGHLKVDESEINRRCETSFDNVYRRSDCKGLDYKNDKGKLLKF